MNIDAKGEKEDDGKDVERQTSCPVRGLKVGRTSEVVTGGLESGLLRTTSLQIQKQQFPPQPTVACWAQFLHVESIRVLLVENDDCTRHVVNALLRNCNYEVVDAANGVQAWKILEDLNNRIDIVLTEVVMPFLPGIPLLSKIMSHKTRKNIPVIMMSSHDSMGLVFQCLSKGAVDFLVKPIRKNELKNLWQHVWRRCHSSSGSGSESATHTPKSVKSRNSEKSDSSGSDDGENDMSNGLNVGDGSDDGSGTQSSWTKQAVEVDSSPAMSPIDQVAERQDSTCAQVIRSNAETLGRKRVHIAVARGDHEQRPADPENKIIICLDNDAEEDDDLEGIISNNIEHTSKNSVENSVAVGSKVNPLVEFECKAHVKRSNEGVDKHAAECSFSKHKGVASEMSILNTDGREPGSTREVAKRLDNCSKEPNLELSLKRLRGVQELGKSTQEERFVLRRSEQSAFSRYNTSSNTFRPPNGITGSSSMFDNCTAASKLESVRNVQAYSADHRVYLGSNGVISNNNLDMGSTTNKLPKFPSSMKDESETTSTINGSYPSAFKQVKSDLRYGPQQINTQNTDLTSARVPYSHHHNFYHTHHSNNFHKVEQQQPSNLKESSSKKLAMDNQIGETMECNLNDNSLNRSVSGSNHVSNVKSGVNTVGTNGESDAGQAGKSGSGDASGSGSGNKIDEDKIARRIAALTKFRQKKKDRCFTKKVRYHNRKKLAEQRPRVRGQFVKQTGTDSSNRNSDE